MTAKQYLPGFALLFLLTPRLSAQEIYSSPYSIYGIGFTHARNSSFNRGLAGTGIGIQDPFHLNLRNPASYGSIVSPISHIYEMGTYVENNQYRTSDLSESSTSGGLTNLSYWFKFKPWWSAVAGLSPYSSVSYDITAHRELGAISNAGYNYEGSGNVSEIFMGNAFDLLPDLSIGVNLAYRFGSISQFESVDLSGSTLTLENKTVVRKLSLDVGMQYKIKIANRALVIGAIADPGMSFTGKQISDLYDNLGDTLHHSNGEEINYRMPPSAGLGLALHAKRSVIAADLKYTRWTDAIFPGDETTFRDTWKFSAGYAYHGNPDGTNYWSVVGLRSGLYMQHYQLELKNNDFPLWGFSIGLSFPVFDNKSSINLTYASDQMGTVNDGLIFQRSQRLMLDIVIRDVWGMKRRVD